MYSRVAKHDNIEKMSNKAFDCLLFEFSSIEKEDF
jgi:hypothetical protein